jgi:hypothetical protein
MKTEMETGEAIASIPTAASAAGAASKAGPGFATTQLPSEPGRLVLDFLPILSPVTKHLVLVRLNFDCRSTYVHIVQIN